MLGALVVGLVVAALPFLLYGSRGHVHAPHSDHAPRHGGQLFMVGDHHLEVISEETRVEIYLSDRNRQPLRPASGRVTLRGGDEIAFQWSRHRLVAELPAEQRAEYFQVAVEDGPTLALPAPDG